MSMFSFYNKIAKKSVHYFFFLHSLDGFLINNPTAFVRLGDLTSCSFFLLDFRCSNIQVMLLWLIPIHFYCIYEFLSIKISDIATETKKNTNFEHLNNQSVYAKVDLHFMLYTFQPDLLLIENQPKMRKSL